MRTLSKQEKIAVGAAIVAVAIIFFGQSVWNAIKGTAQSQTDSNLISATAENKKMNISTVEGLEIYELQEGTGAEARKGAEVVVHYIGTLAADGTKFDSSLDRNAPFTFTLGAGEVIKGWDMGLEGMKVGGVRQLVISPEYAYGQNGIGPIPPNSTLIFHVELMQVKE